MPFLEGQDPHHQNLLSRPSQPSRAWAALFHLSSPKDAFSLPFSLSSEGEGEGGWGQGRKKGRKLWVGEGTEVTTGGT